ncbi:hypothetical protein VC74_gp68 [Mycobacterium phage Sparky]|uniref:Uncharacterized protein n=2 Tax=Caudoviricetes TaxID=2731619 RepID=A0A076G7C8_9CAUD|nr:hypothetical protein VC74_gp68 [Mycobacterium phage Sparky]AII28202.1 hypothetical protein PBI_SPARKY_58 [Mycobacterium phage Sparky]
MATPSIEETNHFAIAEQLLADAAEMPFGDSRTDTLRQARVHAELATAQAMHCSNCLAAAELVTGDLIDPPRNVHPIRPPGDE